MTARLLILSTALVSLSACDRDKPAKSNATGQVLPGSASDAMLPLGTLKSQPPLDASAAAGDASPSASQEPTGRDRPAAKRRRDANAAPSPAASSGPSRAAAPAPSPASQASAE